MTEHVSTVDGVVARNVRRLREEREMTKVDLAERVGLDRQVITDIEDGRGRGREVRWGELVSLCVVFGVPLWDIVLPEIDVGVVVGTSRLPPGTTRRIVTPQGAHDVDEPPLSRHELAALLFGLGDESLTGDQMAHLRRSEQEKEKDRVQAIIAEEVAAAWETIRARVQHDRAREDD